MSEATIPAAPARGEAPKKKRFELFLFAIPHAPLGALALPPIVFLPPYYASQLGIPLEVVSSLFLAARAFDIVLDPFIGSLQDSTRTRFGRRRLWMAIATPILMFAVWLAFIGVGPGANVVQLAIIIFTLYASFAVMVIAHLGWASELRADYHGRTNVLGGVQFAAMVGAMLILILPGVVRINNWGDDADAVHVMGWTVLIALPITVIVSLFFVHEPDVRVHEKLHWRLAFGAIFSNRHLRGILAPDLILGIAQGVSGGLFLFYFQLILDFETQSQALLAIYFVSGVVGVPIWIALGRMIGKHRSLQAACLYAVLVTLCIPLIPPGQFVPAMIMMFIAGLHQGSSAMLLRAMLADVIDVDTLKTGQARAGLFNSIMIITSKVGLATGPITYAVLGAVNFNARPGAENSQMALDTLSWLFVGGPAILFALSALTLHFYKLDEKAQRALRAEIEARSLN